jgi:hypothetical protein
MPSLLQADSYFALGKTHTVCQDYAAIQQDFGGVALAVSDGCSSSPDTDFGSRFLVRGAFNTSYPSLDIQRVLKAAQEAHRALGLEGTCLDATLLFAWVSEGLLSVRAYGDGVVFIRFKDGRSMTWDISFPGQAPAYPNYLTDSYRLETYLKHVSKREMVVTETPGNTTLVSEPIQRENWSFDLQFPLSEIRSVMLCSDGVSSFRRMTTSGALESVPLQEVMAQVTSVKSPNGEFMVRRMRKFLYDFCPKNGWIHEDDVSVAGLVVTE